MVMVMVGVRIMIIMMVSVRLPVSLDPPTASGCQHELSVSSAYCQLPVPFLGGLMLKGFVHCCLDTVKLCLRPCLSAVS